MQYANHVSRSAPMIYDSHGLREVVVIREPDDDWIYSAGDRLYTIGGGYSVSDNMQLIPITSVVAIINEKEEDKNSDK